MNDLTRRRLGLLGGATAVGTGLAASPARAATAPTPVASAPAAAAPALPVVPAAPTTAPGAGGAAAVIGPGDARYQDLVRGINYRFIGQPDHVRLATTVAQVRGAVADAVRENRRITVRSGGHCLEGFVGDPAVRAVIDLSQLTGVYADLPRGAVVVEAGATLGTVYEVLFKRWGGDRARWCRPADRCRRAYQRRWLRRAFPAARAGGRLSERRRGGRGGRLGAGSHGGGDRRGRRSEP
ncbi:FAD-binding protein [Candidatus Frankia nodulisporulans]|uniref:FAD-binding protein n=1 Tax=Candidatus Frankia nodulisporulans TaxID=2060052 RepID=UPI001CDCF4CC|nr:FAD-binding protein [Candidatus Frankia nodulisporulans]